MKKLNTRRLLAVLMLALVLTSFLATNALAYGASGWAYLENGEPVTGWEYIDGAKYYFDDDGIMLTGMQQIDGSWYYFYKNSGQMAKSTVLTKNGKSYKFDYSGKLTDTYSTNSLNTGTNSLNTSAISSHSSYSGTSQNNSYTVYITRTGSKYHSAGCQYLRQSQIAISKSDAIAQGYTACSRCNP